MNIFSPSKFHSEVFLVIVIIICSLVLQATRTTALLVSRYHKAPIFTTSMRMVRQYDNKPAEKVTILGFGSLLSEQSARTTFPDLEGFRLGRVENFRRVFGHPASIFFQRGIAILETKEMSSLSTEPCPGHPGFVCAVFEVSSQNMMKDGVPSKAFLEREEEFNIVTGIKYASVEDPNATGFGILCTKSTDEAYLARWGEERFENSYRKYGISTIWGWGKDSGLRPCPVYLRHCYLAAKGLGDECFESFLDEKFLVDRVTTIREYLGSNPHVLDAQPPSELVGRYSG